MRCRKTLLLSIAAATLAIGSGAPAFAGGQCMFPASSGIICDQMYGDGCHWCYDTAGGKAGGADCTFIGRESYFASYCVSD